MASKLRDEADRAWSNYLRRVGRCERCSATWGRLEAHHVIRRHYTATRHHPDNGLCLCRECHWIMHNTIGEESRLVARVLGADLFESLLVRARAGVGGRYRDEWWQTKSDELAAMR